MRINVVYIEPNRSGQNKEIKEFYRSIPTSTPEEALDKAVEIYNTQRYICYFVYRGIQIDLDYTMTDIEAINYMKEIISKVDILLDTYRSLEGKVNILILKHVPYIIDVDSAQGYEFNGNVSWHREDKNIVIDKYKSCPRTPQWVEER